MVQRSKGRKLRMSNRVGTGTSHGEDGEAQDQSNLDDWRKLDLNLAEISGNFYRDPAYVVKGASYWDGTVLQSWPNPGSVEGTFNGDENYICRRIVDDGILMEYVGTNELRASNDWTSGSIALKDGWRINDAAQNYISFSNNL